MTACFRRETIAQASAAVTTPSTNAVGTSSILHTSKPFGESSPPDGRERDWLLMLNSARGLVEQLGAEAPTTCVDAGLRRSGCDDDVDQSSEFAVAGGFDGFVDLVERECLMSER